MTEASDSQTPLPTSTNSTAPVVAVDPSPTDPAPTTPPVASSDSDPTSSAPTASLSTNGSPPSDSLLTSAAIASSHPPPSVDSSDEPATKRQRKRKSLWDQPSPSATTAALPTTPALTTPANPIPPPFNPSPFFTQLQSQLALLPHLSTPFPTTPLPPQLSSSHALSSPSTASRLDRRIYVGSLAYDIPEDSIRVIFEPFGTVAKVDMPKEPGHFPIRSKGFCFVEFERVDSAKAALMTMNGVPLRGRPMKVGKPTGGAGSEYGSFLTQLMQGGAQGLGALAGQQLNSTALAAIKAAQIASGGTFSPATLTNPPPFTLPGAGVGGGAERIPGSVGGSSAKTRIYVGSLMWELTEEAVRAIFEPFGAIKSCSLILNPDTGKHRGYGFVEFVEEKSAAHAIQEMDGFDLIGRKLKVNYASALVAPQSSQHGGGFGGGFGGHGGPPSLPPGFTIPSLPSLLGSTSAPPTSLSAEDNIRIHSHEQRASIMQKLSDSGRQSPVLLLKNLVSPSEVDPDLNGEVADECSKFGVVREVKVVPDAAGGVVRVYVRFDSAVECGKAVEGLNGRFFDKRAVSAEFYPEVKFNSQIYGDANA